MEEHELRNWLHAHVTKVGYGLLDEGIEEEEEKVGPERLCSLVEIFLGVCLEPNSRERTFSLSDFPKFQVLFHAKRFRRFSLLPNLGLLLMPWRKNIVEEDGERKISRIHSGRKGTEKVSSLLSTFQ